MRKTPKNIEQAFIEAYDQYSVSILRHIYFRVDKKSVAEDLLSETFMKTWESVRQGNEIRNYKAFLYRVAHNLIIDYYRSRTEMLSIDDEDEVVLPIGPMVEEGLVKQLDDGLTMDKVKRCLANLLPDYREVITLRYIDDLSIREIQEITGKTSANIYVIIHRGLKELKKQLVTDLYHE
jgi:RNA polymerase sigma-70 factor (ECF subfamily)